MSHKSEILIFTDGASRGNPGPGGWGAIIAYSLGLGSSSFEDKVIEIGGREEMTTNNRMELTAAIEALSIIHNSKFIIHLYTDSSYLINGITKWIHGWKKNGWKTKAKQDVENQDLWEALDKLAADKQIEWQKVEGHSGHGANERCDEIATSFADNLSSKLYSGPLSDYKVSLNNNSPAKKEIFYVSLADGVSSIDKTWKECESRVKGKTGARFKKVISREEAERVLADWEKK